jgi:hypothetical protein
VADSNGAMILGIAPTNEADPRLDGTVVVLASPVASTVTLVASTSVASCEPEVVLAAPMVVAEVSSEETIVSMVDKGADAIHTGRAAAHQAASAASVVSLVVSQVADAVFPFGTPVLALATVLSEQHPADRLFQAMAHGAVDSEDLALTAGAAEDAFARVLVRQLSSSRSMEADVDSLIWDSADAEPAWLPDLGGPPSRQGRQEAVQPGNSQPAVADPAALSTYFALLAAADDAADLDDEE